MPDNPADMVERFDLTKTASWPQAQKCPFDRLRNSESIGNVHSDLPRNRHEVSLTMRVSSRRGYNFAQDRA